MKTLEKVSDFVGKYMAAIVIVVAALALFFPGTFSVVKTAWVNTLLGIVMFGMGLTLKPEDFKVVFSRPKDVIIGCFAGCLHITRGNVNFDVLTGFKACLNDAFSNNILTATVPSFKADLRYTNRKFAMKIYLEMYRSGRNENDSKSNWLFGSGFPVLLGFMRVFRLRERTIFGRSLLKFSPKFSQNARSILKFNMWSITQVVVRGRTRNAIGRETGARVRLPDAPPNRMDR